MSDTVFSNDLSLMIEKVRYEVQFVDYSENEWTVPLLLTEKRAQEIMKDQAISKVRFSDILSPLFSLTFDYNQISMHNEEQRKLLSTNMFKA